MGCSLSLVSLQIKRNSKIDPYSSHNTLVTQPSLDRRDRIIDEILKVLGDHKLTLIQLWNFTQLDYSFYCLTLTKAHSNLDSMFFRNHRKPKLEAGNSIDYFSSQEHLRLHPQTDIEMYQVCHLSALNLSPLCFQSSDSNPLDLAGFW